MFLNVLLNDVCVCVCFIVRSCVGACVGALKMPVASSLQPPPSLLRKFPVPPPHKASGYRLVGDANFDECKAVAGAITPVPGASGFGGRRQHRRRVVAGD